MLHPANKPSGMLQQAISPLRTLMLAQSVVLDSAGLPPRSVLMPARRPPSALTMIASSGDVGRSAGTSAVCQRQSREVRDVTEGRCSVIGERPCAVTHTYRGMRLLLAPNCHCPENDWSRWGRALTTNRS